jgi:hypothetical protein
LQQVKKGGITVSYQLKEFDTRDSLERKVLGTGKLWGHKLHENKKPKRAARLIFLPTQVNLFAEIKMTIGTLLQ